MATVKTTSASPSGKYCLTITHSPTTTYTLSRIHDDSHVITRESPRLYSNYNFLQDGDREYFITSQSPRGITIIDCETGYVWTYEPETMDEWYPSWTLVPKSNILVLNGYIRCGSYVFWRFYDFDLTKFKEGLPELEEILPFDEAELDDRGSFTIYQGKDIPVSIVKDVKIDPDMYYLVFTRPIEYNMAARMPQDDLLFNPEDWLPLLPNKDDAKVKSFFEKWDTQDVLKSFKLYYDEKRKLQEEFASYLEKDVVTINSQEAILCRQDDTIVYLVLRNILDEETGELSVSQLHLN